MVTITRLPENRVILSFIFRFILSKKCDLKLHQNYSTSIRNYQIFGATSHLNASYDRFKHVLNKNDNR